MSNAAAGMASVELGGLVMTGEDKRTRCRGNPAAVPGEHT